MGDSLLNQNQNQIQNKKMVMAMMLMQMILNLNLKVMQIVGKREKMNVPVMKLLNNVMQKMKEIPMMMIMKLNSNGSHKILFQEYVVKLEILMKVDIVSKSVMKRRIMMIMVCVVLKIYWRNKMIN